MMTKEEYVNRRNAINVAIADLRKEETEKKKTIALRYDSVRRNIQREISDYQIKIREAKDRLHKRTIDFSTENAEVVESYKDKRCALYDEQVRLDADWKEQFYNSINN